jgi:rhodanese-related sulfurtransferase
MTEQLMVVTNPRAGSANRRALTTDAVELYLMLQRNEDVIVVDVRPMEDYERGHIPGAINVEPRQWRESERFCNDTLNIVYGYSSRCRLAGAAAMTFAARGYHVVEMDGGFEAWISGDFETETV